MLLLHLVQLSLVDNSVAYTFYTEDLIAAWKAAITMGECVRRPDESNVNILSTKPADLALSPARTAVKQELQPDALDIIKGIQNVGCMHPYVHLPQAMRDVVYNCVIAISKSAAYNICGMGNANGFTMLLVYRYIASRFTCALIRESRIALEVTVSASDVVRSLIAY